MMKTNHFGRFFVLGMDVLFIAISAQASEFEDFKTAYSDMESTLISRFVEEKNSFNTNIAETINVMGNIRSGQSVNYLLDNIDLMPEWLPQIQNGFTPFIPVSGYGVRSVENTFPAVAALHKILCPVQSCLSSQVRYALERRVEIAQACGQLGKLCHGEIYFTLGKDEGVFSIVTQSVDNVIATTSGNSLSNMSNSAISETYCSMETNLFSYLSNAISNLTSETASAIETAGHIRSAKCRDLLLDNIAFTTNAPPETATGPQPTEDCYPVVKALAEIGMPFGESLDLIENAEQGSLRERLLVRLAELSHGFVFTNYVHSFGNSPTNRYSRIISEYGL